MKNGKNVTHSSCLWVFYCAMCRRESESTGKHLLCVYRYCMSRCRIVVFSCRQRGCSRRDLLSLPPLILLWAARWWWLGSRGPGALPLFQYTPCRVVGLQRAARALCVESRKDGFGCDDVVVVFFKSVPRAARGRWSSMPIGPSQ